MNLQSTSYLTRFQTIAVVADGEVWRWARGGRKELALPQTLYEEAELLLDAYCNQEMPEHVRQQLRYGYLASGNAITLFAERPHFLNKARWIRENIARFRYTKLSQKWTLYFQDRNLKWRIYEHIKPSSTFSKLLKEVEKDPTHIFWG